MESVKLNRNSWVFRATQYKPFFSTKRREVPDTTCDLFASLIHSAFLLVLFAVFVWNSFLFTIGFFGDIFQSFVKGFPHFFMLLDEGTFPSMFHVINGATTFFGLDRTGEVALVFFSIPSILLSITLPVLVIIGIPIFLIMFGPDIYRQIAYSFYVKRTENPVSYNDWKYGRKHGLYKTSLGLYLMETLEGPACAIHDKIAKVCRKIEWSNE